MPSVTKYPGSITHDTHTSEYTSWADITGIKTAANYGYTNTITGKTGNHPKVSPLLAKGFGFNIPEGATITSIVVEYSHRKMYETATNYPSIAGPTFTLLGTNVPSKYSSKTGASPPNASFSGKKVLKWNGVYANNDVINVSDVDLNNPYLVTNETYDLPDVETINSYGFGVRIAYPQNTSSNQGKIHLQFLRITVNYEIPDYDISLVNQNNDDVYANIEQPIRVTVNNLDMADYSPTLVITLPSGAEVKSISQSSVVDYGTVSINGNVVTWNAKLNVLRGYVDILINATFTQGQNQTITAVEQLYNHSGSMTLNVLPAQTGIIDTSDVDVDQVLFVKESTDFVIPIQIPITLLDSGIENLYLIPDKSLMIKTGTSSYSTISADGYYTIAMSRFDEEGHLDLTAKTENLGITNIGLSTTTVADANNFIVKCIPSTLTNPIFTILKLDEEELARLGHEITYTINSSLKIKCDASHISDFVDYYRNFRFGVVNHIESTNDRLEIFEACKNWSTGVSVFNSFDEKTIEFNYNEDYPVYLIFVGNYQVNNYFNLDFTYPCFIESNKYSGYDTLSIFSTPFNNLLDNTNNSELNLQGYDKANMIIISDFPLNTDFGTDDTRAVRGIQLYLEVETERECILSARLKSNTGKIGEQSVLLIPNQKEYSFGGAFDLWGFSIGDMQNVEDWEIELEISNYDSEQTTVFINNIQVTVFFLELDTSQREQIFVEGENLEWYGAFIEDFNVLSGAKTNTKFLNITGSDVNDAYLMTLKEKEIKLKFSIDGCSLKESTALLTQITKLITNKRTEIDKPIPKQIESSFRENEYYKYILEAGIDADINMTGYDCEAKLTVPDGTSFKKNETVSNATGVANAFGKVFPRIIIIPTDETIGLTEEYTQQKFSAGHTGWNGKYVEIDCTSQKMYLKDDLDGEKEDITVYGDYNNDWFSLEGVYKFIPTNCILHSVTYTERGG